MNIYIAGKFEAQTRLREIRDRIRAVGDDHVVSTWLDEESTSEPTPQNAANYAKRDIAEVAEANLFILDTQDNNLRGGREVEFGVALAMGLALWIVGPPRNVFHHLANAQFDTWDAAISALSSEWRL